MVKVSEIDSNDWNPNEMTQEEFKMLLDNVVRIGFSDPLLVTKIGKRYKIIDGEHRYRAAIIAGIEELPVVIVKLNEADQMLQTVRMNQIKGDWNPKKFNILISDMMTNGELTVDEAAFELGFADPNDFYLLRDLLRESLPSTRLRKEFDIQVKSAGNIQDLYDVLNNLMAKMEDSKDKNVWIVTNKDLVAELIELDRHCLEEGTHTSTKLIQIIQQQLKA